MLFSIAFCGCRNDDPRSQGAFINKIARIALVAAALTGVIAGPASAGAYIDDLSKCLVAKASPNDQTAFVRWIFAAMAFHPAVNPLSNIPQPRRDEIDSKAGQLMMRLMTVDCRAQLVSALKHEGNSAIESAFGALTQVAIQGLMSDPAVIKGEESFGKNIDRAKLQEMFKEAGVPSEAASPNAPGK